MDVSAIGLDLAKNVFQLHGVDASGKVVIRKAIGLGSYRPGYYSRSRLQPLAWSVFAILRLVIALAAAFLTAAGVTVPLLAAALAAIIAAFGAA
jgi:hypothetical protein